ncbi:hypothetical protein BH09BAC2_BH09BAC2_14960 [soil metagenome]
MNSILYLLLISFGALFIVSIFQFCIYLQQHDKAFLYYAMYLFTMSGFVLVRILDERLTKIFPLTYHSLEILDPVLSNISFLMYVNFLGVVLNITKTEKFYYKSWKALRFIVIIFLTIYCVLQIINIDHRIPEAIITAGSFTVIIYGAILAFRLFRFIDQTFYKLIIAGTVVAVIGVLSGLVVNNFIFHEKLSFAGLYFLLPAMMIETFFLSAALGYRLKLASDEKDKAQNGLLQQTKRNEQLALQTASLLRKELDIHEMQKRISKDLHDDVGASLSGIALYSHLTKSQIKNNQTEKVQQSLDVIEENAVAMVSRLSDIVWAIDPAHNSLSDLLLRLEEYIIEMATIKNIETCFIGTDTPLSVKLPPDHIRNMYLIFKEGVNNSIKYSRCRKLNLKVKHTFNTIIFSLEDDGSGFDINKHKAGNGLINMKQRADEINAELILESRSTGTTLQVCLKIPQ